MSILRANFGKTILMRCLLPARLVHLFIAVSERAVLEDTTTLGDASSTGQNSLCSRLHSPCLPCNETSSKVATGASATLEEWKTLPLFCLFITSGNVPSTLGDFYTRDLYTRDLYTSAFFAWGSPSMRVLIPLEFSRLAFSLGLQTPVVTHLR